MARTITHLTSSSPSMKASASSGRRLLALLLCAMLVLTSTLPAVALAVETDSEAEGGASPVDAPGVTDFDPGGGDTVLEDAAATVGGGDGETEESEPVEVEPASDPEALEVAQAPEAPAPGEVTSAATEGEVGGELSEPPAAPAIPPAAESEAAPVPQKAEGDAVAEPVENQDLVAPKQVPAVERSAASEVAVEASPSPEAVGSESPPAERPPEHAAPTPHPAAVPSGDVGRSLAGKKSYVVRHGDCLWHIAASLLPAGASSAEIAREVERLWRLNKDRIGSNDPSLIYAGTKLLLR